MTSKTDLVGNLFPTLIQCFGTIILGFLFGQTKILRNGNAHGLCILLQYLSLPSLIFTSLATLSFDNVKWPFVASILVSKAIVFILVTLLTIVLTRPAHLGKSGIYAIAATQSNDLALGYPLMVSLYRTCHQDFPSILYIVVPIQLLLLNPIGFFMMETHKQINDPSYRQERKFYIILKGILKNPVIMMTILGLVWNLSFSHCKIPPMINQLLEALGSIFSTIALFLLGHGMSSEGNEPRRRFSLSPALILLAKILLLPIILQKTTIYMMSGSNQTEIQSLSSFGFLYGTIPTAPSVFVFAKHYDIAVDVITSTTVYSTIFSAPLMFTSAMMISLIQDRFTDFKYYLTRTTCYIGAVNLICCILLTIIFLIKKQWHNIYFIGIIYMLTAQVITAIGSILYFFCSENSTVIVYASFALQTVGQFSTHMYAVFIAALFYLLHWRSLCFVLKHRMKIKSYGFVIPLSLSIIITVFLTGTKTDSAESFELSKYPYITNIVISTATLVITVVLLVLGHRCMNKNKLLVSEEQKHSNKHVDESQSLIKRSISCETSKHGCDCKKSLCDQPGPSGNAQSSGRVIELDDSSDEEFQFSPLLIQCSSSRICSKEQRMKCTNNIENYQNELATHDIDNISNFKQYKRCMILLVSLCCCMLVSISESLSKILTDTETGAFIELQFLNVVLRNGQGIFCLCLLCVDMLSSKVISRSERYDTSHEG